MTEPENDAAVLVSGGLDSAVLCIDLLGEFRRVTPLFIRSGLRWEAVELESLGRFLAAVNAPRVDPLVVLDEPIADVYGAHWSTTGRDVPKAQTEDAAVYLPGRNLLLAVKAAVWCRLRGRQALAMGCLGSNPFPDSTPAFFSQLEGVLALALSGSPRLLRPFDHLHKSDVINRGRQLPLHLTFSCIDPVDGRHCGRCNKCAERRQGFRDASVSDLTFYVS